MRARDGKALVFADARVLVAGMPHDPHAAFDLSVLEMIEHSPVGKVPVTPSYQDAVRRLRASHQIYADADHADGFVTARSLATRPAFHAQNLDALIAGTIAPAELEANAAIFDRYVASLAAAVRPKAENRRLVVVGRPVHHRKHGGIVVSDPVHTVFLVPGAGPNPGIAGNYLYGALLQVGADPMTDSWAIHLHDSDDGVAISAALKLPAALEKLQEAIMSAPFHMEELGALGFEIK